MKKLSASAKDLIKWLERENGMIALSKVMDYPKSKIAVEELKNEGIVIYDSPGSGWSTMVVLVE